MALFQYNAYDTFQSMALNFLDAHCSAASYICLAENATAYPNLLANRIKNLDSRASIEIFMRDPSDTDQVLARARVLGDAMLGNFHVDEEAAEKANAWFKRLQVDLADVHPQVQTLVRAGLTVIACNVILFKRLESDDRVRFFGLTHDEPLKEALICNQFLGVVAPIDPSHLSELSQPKQVQVSDVKKVTGSLCAADNRVLLTADNFAEIPRGKLAVAVDQMVCTAVFKTHVKRRLHMTFPDVFQSPDDFE